MPAGKQAENSQGMKIAGQRASHSARGLFGSIPARAGTPRPRAVHGQIAGAIAGRGSSGRSGFIWRVSVLRRPDSRVAKPGFIFKRIVRACGDRKHPK